MEQLRRATIYLKPRFFRALKLKAVQRDRSVSDLVNEAVCQSLAEDVIDLEAINQRRKDPERDFESFLMDLHKDGLL